MIKSLCLLPAAAFLLSGFGNGGRVLAGAGLQPGMDEPASLSTKTPANDWHISGPFGGTALAIALDPQHPSTLLAGGMESLLFKSEDSGATLVGLLAVGDGALFESHDAGKTWKPNKDLSSTGVPRPL